MPVDEFIISVFCWVEKSMESVTSGVTLRQRGAPPRLSDAEVITMELGSEFLGYVGGQG